MADTKVTDLAALTGANVATGDDLLVVDVSDTSMAASGTDKKITADELAIAFATVLGIVGRDKLWDTKGDLAVATGADAASKLAAGSDGSRIVADASQTTGLRWAAESIYGDGSDGNVTVTSGTTTLTRDMYYDSLIVNNGATLATANCRVYCKTKCQVDTGGDINNNGANASGSTAGANAAGVTLNKGAAGGAGGTAAGSAGTTQAAAFAGSGGAGGLGASGAGGAAGTVTAPTAQQGHLRSVPGSLLGHLFTNNGGVGTVVLLTGGGGGGGGGGDGTAGGGGGAAGGIVLIAARTLIVNGTIRVLGGNGANAAAGNRGGGGGGGGGLLLLTYNVISGSTTLSAATHCAGGTHGNKTGTGVNGSDGSVGTLIQVAA